MATEVTEKAFKAFTWSDVYIPNKEDVAGAATRFGLGRLQVYDSVQSGHLPKYEKDDRFTFMILRGLVPELDPRSVDLRELSNKIAIFYNAKEVITIHGGTFNFLKLHIDDEFECAESLVLSIIRNVIKKYDDPAHHFSEAVSKTEETVFLKDTKKISLEHIYFQKAQLRIAKNLLSMNRDVLDKLDISRDYRSEFQDIREDVVHFLARYDELYENSNNLLSTYLSINAQRNNDIVRVLTIFSAFFLPLTFVVGVYGMNFKFFPELDWQYGYPASLSIMVVISLGIYIWFRKKGML
jgi:magnesium transporter